MSGIDLGQGAILLVTGVACGLINTLASSGSAISLPILLMLGLPPLTANATNRLSVLFGSLMALRTFQSEKKVDCAAGAKMVLPATLGSIIGVWAAKILPSRDMELAIVGAVLIALLLLLTKLKAILERPKREAPHVSAMALVALGFVGFWLGFLVLDGATYLLIVLILLCSFDLPHANALKVLVLIPTTLVPIAMFAWAGDIRWTEGILLSIGSIVGGHFGAKLSSHARAKHWVFEILLTVITLELIHLGVQYFGPWLKAVV